MEKCRFVCGHYNGKPSSLDSLYGLYGNRYTLTTECSCKCERCKSLASCNVITVIKGDGNYSERGLHMSMARQLPNVSCKFTARGGELNMICWFTSGQVKKLICRMSKPDKSLKQTESFPLAPVEAHKWVEGWLLNTSVQIRSYIPRSAFVLSPIAMRYSRVQVTENTMIQT